MRPELQDAVHEGLLDSRPQPAVGDGRLEGLVTRLEGVLVYARGGMISRGVNAPDGIFETKE